MGDAYLPALKWYVCECMYMIAQGLKAYADKDHDTACYYVVRAGILTEYIRGCTN